DALFAAGAKVLQGQPLAEAVLPEVLRTPGLAKASLQLLGDSRETFAQQANYIRQVIGDFASVLRGSPAELERFVADYEYDISPSTDDMPFFFNYYRWSSLLGGQRGGQRGGQPGRIHDPSQFTYTTDFPVGHMVLLASLLQILLLASLLIFLPLRKLAHEGFRTPGVVRYFGYFAALGLGFMLFEIALMQKLVIFLGHPTYALSVVLVSLLASAGTGSLLAGRIEVVGKKHLSLILLGIVAVGLFDTWAIDAVLPLLLGQSLEVRMLVVVLMLIPTGLVLGMPFPSGMRLMETQCPHLVPWGWAVNAFFSVFGSIFCIVLSMEIGFTNVLFVAIGIYMLGLLGMKTKASAATAGSAPQLSPALWVPAGHFYSPIPNPLEVRADESRVFPRGLREMAGIELHVDRQMALARELAQYYGEEDFPETPRADRRYCLANDFFPYGDAFVYYALLRRLRPRRMIEVGSGWSSAVLLDTDERFLGGSIECTFIEPYPERLQGLLRPDDVRRTKLWESRVQHVPLEVFDVLQANDILFVDSSHVCKTGSDVHHILFEILPRLQNGVWVHFHDIFQNFEYHPSWVYEGRAWNESYFLRAFLTNNPQWTIQIHGATLATVAGHELLPLMPKVGQNVGGSIWLMKG
ncbi:MAG: class I SAM-dependent methyltransferase, partial [Planctomycetota bacterium]